MIFFGFAHGMWSTHMCGTGHLSVKHGLHTLHCACTHFQCGSNWVHFPCWFPWCGFNGFSCIKKVPISMWFSWRWQRAMLAEWKSRQTSALTDVQPHSHTCNTTLFWTAWIKNFQPWGQSVKFKYCLRYIPCHKKYWPDWPQGVCVCVQSLCFTGVLCESGFRNNVTRNIDKTARLHMPAMFICTQHCSPYFRWDTGQGQIMPMGAGIANSVKVCTCEWHQLWSRKSMVWVHFWCHLQGLKLCSCACMCVWLSGTMLQDLLLWS